jgi:hypothetical protein
MGRIRGCQIFLYTAYQNGNKCTNYVAIKYTKWPYTIHTKCP